MFTSQSLCVLATLGLLFHNSTLWPGSSNLVQKLPKSQQILNKIIQNSNNEVSNRIIIPFKHLLIKCLTRQYLLPLYVDLQSKTKLAVKGHSCFLANTYGEREIPTLTLPHQPSKTKRFKEEASLRIVIDNFTRHFWEKPSKSLALWNWKKEWWFFRWGRRGRGKLWWWVVRRNKPIGLQQNVGNQRQKFSIKR